MAASIQRGMGFLRSPKSMGLIKPGPPAVCIIMA